MFYWLYSNGYAIWKPIHNIFVHFISFLLMEPKKASILVENSIHEQANP